MFHYCAFDPSGIKIAELRTVFDVRKELHPELRAQALRKFNEYFLQRLGTWDGKSFQWGLVFMVHEDHSFEPIYMVTPR